MQCHQIEIFQQLSLMISAKSQLPEETFWFFRINFLHGKNWKARYLSWRTCPTSQGRQSSRGRWVFQWGKQCPGHHNSSWFSSHLKLSPFTFTFWFSVWFSVSLTCWIIIVNWSAQAVPSGRVCVSGFSASLWVPRDVCGSLGHSIFCLLPNSFLLIGERLDCFEVLYSELHRCCWYFYLYCQ